MALTLGLLHTRAMIVPCFLIKYLTPLGLQSEFGYKSLEIRVICRFLYTAVLNGLTTDGAPKMNDYGSGPCTVPVE